MAPARPAVPWRCGAAISPIGGVGINLAIQDAVTAANILAWPLLQGAVAADDLSAVQRRREFPTRATQGLQVFVQNRLISRVLANPRAIRAPLLLRLLSRWPYLRRFPPHASSASAFAPSM